MRARPHPDSKERKPMDQVILGYVLKCLLVLHSLPLVIAAVCEILKAWAKLIALLKSLL